jgi:hypothetical protein
VTGVQTCALPISNIRFYEVKEAGRGPPDKKRKRIVSGTYHTGQIDEELSEKLIFSPPIKLIP